jgi:hypothetical protein
MDVDQPGQYQAIPAFDHPVRRSGVIPSDKDDPIVCKRDVDIASIGVPPCTLIPDNAPIRVADNGRGHGTPLRKPAEHTKDSAAAAAYALLV